jgi:hypothetical protein
MIATLQSTRIALATLAAALLVADVASAKWSWKPSKIFSLDSTWPFKNKDEPQEGTPTRMVCTWTDTVMTQPGVKPQRGFGGRIMFYERDEKKPILVDGQLIVYAFDEAGREPTDNKPTRRYVFPADQIPLHMSKNEFGASYSFFLPWDEAGGPRTEISLICRFQPADGGVIASEQTRQVLPGTLAAVPTNGTPQPPKLPEGVPSKPAQVTLQTLQAQRALQQQGQLAQQAIYEMPAQPNMQPGAPVAAAEMTVPAATPPRQMTSTTINLPNSYQMPSAAAVMNSQPPATAQPQPQFIPVPVMQQQPAPAQPAIQPTSGNSASTFPANMVQQASYTTTASGPRSPMTATRASYNTTPNSQIPAMQQQFQHSAQQASLQQQLQQQQMMQQQALQQRMLHQQVPVQPAAGQLPMQAMGAATVGYPTMR